MTCYYPLAGYCLLERGNKWSYRAPAGEQVVPMSVSCQQCVGCRLERARQWAVRCEHEISLYERNCFITLTYDDYYLPDDESLQLRDVQLFMKRLRKRFGAGIRVLYAGEYGEQNRRPHYHAILFNFDFDDRKPFKKLASGFTVDTSDTLNDVWGLGFTSVGSATFESAGYCARYCLKKVNGDMAEAHYRHVTRYGVEVQLTPEFAHMSQGIGREWLARFEGDVFPADQVVSRGGRLSKPPRYYEKKFGERCPLVLEELKDRRYEAGVAAAWNNTPERLAVREQVQLARLRHLKREL